MPRLEAVGVVFIGMGWCNGPGARVWRGVKPPAHLVPSNSCKIPVLGRFWGRKKSPYFDYPTVLGASGGLAPSFLSSSAFFPNPQKVPVRPDFVFFLKKSWAKMAILSPGPNVDRSRSWTGPGPARARLPDCVGPKLRTIWPSTSMGVSKGDVGPAGPIGSRA